MVACISELGRLLFSSEGKVAFAAIFYLLMQDYICEKPVKAVFWSTNTVRNLYSFWALFTLYWVHMNNKESVISIFCIGQKTR